MLHHRQELNMGKSQLSNVIRELGSKFSVGEMAVPFLRHPAPGAQMYLIDGDRSVKGIARASAIHPGPVSPVIVQVPDDRGRSRWRFAMEGKWVGFIRVITAVMRDDVVFVDCPFVQPGNETLPNTRLAFWLQGMACLIPAVERAYDRDLFGVGCPNSEIGPPNPVPRCGMSSKLVIESIMRPFIEKKEVIAGQ